MQKHLKHLSPLLPALVMGAAGFMGCSPAQAPAPAPEEPVRPVPQYSLSQDQTHNRFSRLIPPVVRVPSGAIVEAYTKEASDQQISPQSTVEDLINMDSSLVHPLTGPVFVEGAEPGDILAVKLLEIEPLGWGWTSIRAGGGFLTDEVTEPYLKTFTIDPGQDSVKFSEGIFIPLAPFPGVMGVAPDTDEMLRTRPPRENGGNMDNKYLRVGTTVYFPVWVAGALFSIGDTHAAQGDGEVSGVAIEAPMRIVYQVQLLKGRSIPEPQYETDEYYAVTAFATTIDEAARKATRYMIDHLESEHGMSRVEAYALCSLAGDLKISEVVDLPHVLVSMHMPKSVFAPL